MMAFLLSFAIYLSLNEIASESQISEAFQWEQRESNPRPSACKADALNQLSYAPFSGADGTRTRDPGVTGRYSNQLNYRTIVSATYSPFSKGMQR